MMYMMGIVQDCIMRWSIHGRFMFMNNGRYSFLELANALLVNLVEQGPEILDLY
jgi:hypothetical protein